MTRKEHEIRRQILRNLRVRIIEAGQACDAARKAYLLGLEAGQLMQGGGRTELNALGRNFEEAKKIGVKIEVKP